MFTLSFKYIGQCPPQLSAIHSPFILSMQFAHQEDDGEEGEDEGEEDDEDGGEEDGEEEEEEGGEGEEETA